VNFGDVFSSGNLEKGCGMVRREVKEMEAQSFFMLLNCLGLAPPAIDALAGERRDRRGFSRC
jgi:hypothetical protein